MKGFAAAGGRLVWRLLDAVVQLVTGVLYLAREDRRDAEEEDDGGKPG